MKFGKSAIASLLANILLLRKRPTAQLVGPETMIPSPNRFALPWAGPFHKINAGCEATTTVSSSCLMYGYYYDAILLREPRKICGTSAKSIHQN